VQSTDKTDSIKI